MCEWKRMKKKFHFNLSLANFIFVVAFDLILMLSTTRGRDRERQRERKMKRSEISHSTLVRMVLNGGRSRKKPESKSLLNVFNPAF